MKYLHLFNESLSADDIEFAKEIFFRVSDKWDLCEVEEHHFWAHDNEDRQDASGGNYHVWLENELKLHFFLRPRESQSKHLPEIEKDIINLKPLLSDRFTMRIENRERTLRPGCKYFGKDRILQIYLRLKNK